MLIILGIPYVLIDQRCKVDLALVNLDDIGSNLLCHLLSQ